MLGSLPKCSTTLFTMVEAVEGVEVLGVPAVVVWLVVLRVAVTAFSTTSFSRLLSPTVMLVAGPAWSVVLTTEEVTGTVVFSSNPS